MACDSKTFSSFLCLIVILLFACSLCTADDDFDDYNKQKRASSGSSGLFPFPRVGRSDPSLFSEYEYSPYSFGPYENYDEMRRQDKRQGLVPFPRVGRSSADGFNQHFWVHEKRSLQGPSSAANPNAMWFGPRLGKRAPHGDQGDHQI